MKDIHEIEHRFAARCDEGESRLNLVTQCAIQTHAEIADLERRQQARLDAIDASSDKLAEQLVALQQVVDYYVKHPELGVPARYVEYVHKIVDETAARSAKRVDDAASRLSARPASDSSEVTAEDLDKLRQGLTDALNKKSAEAKNDRERLLKPISDDTTQILASVGIPLSAILIMNAIVLLFTLWSRLPDAMKAAIARLLSPPGKS